MQIKTFRPKTHEGQKKRAEHTIISRVVPIIENRALLYLGNLLQQLQIALSLVFLEVQAFGSCLVSLLFLH